MKLSIIVPAFNEAATIGLVIEKLLRQNLGNWQKEIIVVDDGSTDSTLKVLKSFGDKIKIVRFKTNRGKGAAIQRALERVKGEAVIIQDADLEYDPADIPALLAELEKSGLDVIYGSREIHPQRRGYPHYVLGVKLLTFLTNLRFGSRLTDVYTGYKLIRTDLLKSLDLKSNGFEIEMELTLKILRRGIHIKELPIHYRPRKFKEGKKIRFGDAVKGFLTLLNSFFDRPGK